MVIEVFNNPFISTQTAIVESFKSIGYFFSRLFRVLFHQGKSIIEDEISKMATKVNKISMQTLVQAIDNDDFPSMKQDILFIIQELNDEQKKELLTKLIQLDIEKQQKTNLNKLFNLLDVQECRKLLSIYQNDFKNVQDLAKTLDQLYHLQPLFSKNQGVEKQSFTFIQSIKNFFNNLLVAFNLLQLGKEPKSYFETKYMLDIYWKILFIPFEIGKFIFNLFLTPLKGAIAVLGAIGVTAAISTFFTKVFKMRPKELPFCENLTEKARTGELPRLHEREKEINEIIDTLTANNDISKINPILLGNSGVGKTEIMNALAHRIKEENAGCLNGKELFYLKTDSLVEEFNTLQTPLEQIMAKMEDYKKDFVLILDEVQAIEKKPDLLNSITDSFYYTICITCPSDLKNRKLFEMNSGVKRRLKIIPIEATVRATNIAIMQLMMQDQGSDFDLSDKFIEKIADVKLETLEEPTKSTQILSTLINNAKKLTPTNKLLKEKNELLQTIRNLSKKPISTDVTAIYSEENQVLIAEIERLKQQLDDVEAKLIECKKEEEKEQNLNNHIEWHENWNKKTASQIHQDYNLTNAVPESLEKAFLWNQILLHLMKKEISKKPKIVIDKKLVKEAIEQERTYNSLKVNFCTPL